MVHSGYEATAVKDSVTRPWKLAELALAGIKTDGPMAPDIALDHQRPAQYVFSRNVQQKLSEIAEAEARPE